VEEGSVDGLRERVVVLGEVACGVGFVDVGRCAEKVGKEEANETCLFGCESWVVIGSLQLVKFVPSRAVE